MKQTTLLMNCGMAIALVVSGRLFGSADGHGMMLDPPSRSSMWRYGFNVPPNYNENGLNCGGYGVRQFLFRIVTYNTPHLMNELE